MGGLAISTENKFFRILSYRVQIEGSVYGSKWTSSSEATMKVRITKRDGKAVIEHKVADGNGPVNALDNALRKALADHFPEIADVHLIDYEVYKPNDESGTESSVEVKVTSSDGINNWVTTGVSTNSIEASLVAVAKGIEKELLRLQK